MCETKRLPFKLCWNYTSYIQNGNPNMILNLFCWRILYQIHVTNIFYYHQCYLYSICIYRQNCSNDNFFSQPINLSFCSEFHLQYIPTHGLILNNFRFYSTQEVSPFTYHKRSPRFNSQGSTNIKPSYAYLY